MTGFLTWSAPTYAVLAAAGATLIAVYLTLAPGRVRLAPHRRRPVVGPTVSLLTRVTERVTTLIGRVLQRRNPKVHIAVLERAGVTRRLQDVVLLVMVAALVAAAVGLVLAGPVVALVLAALVPLLVRMGLGVMAGRRRAAFADQLDDSLQLIASSLRAGHSLLQALAAVARDSEQPTSVEFARIMNETRVGRQLNDALDETAARMESVDFTWVTQAVAINREAGGNLAEVLDGVAHTIRERNQIRRQVKALSAEGKLSAYVLMALPFGIGAFLMVANRPYMAKFTQSLMGYAMLGTCVVLLVGGGLWLRKVVSFKF